MSVCYSATSFFALWYRFCLAVGLLCGLCLGREKGQLEGKNGQVEGTKGHGARFFFLVRDSSLQRMGCA